MQDGEGGIHNEKKGGKMTVTVQTVYAAPDWAAVWTWMI